MVELGFRAKDGRSYEESGKEDPCKRVAGRKGTEWVESIQVESGLHPGLSCEGNFVHFHPRGDPSTGAISAGTGEFCARSWRRQRRRRIIPRRKVPRYRRPAPSSRESLWNNERAGQIDETGERRISRKYQDIIDFSRPSLGLWNGLVALEKWKLPNHYSSWQLTLMFIILDFWKFANEISNN